MPQFSIIHLADRVGGGAVADYRSDPPSESGHLSRDCDKRHNGRGGSSDKIIGGSHLQTLRPV
jgi:hypothetical protein